MQTGDDHIFRLLPFAGVNSHKLEGQFWPPGRRFRQHFRFQMVITRQHQNALIRLGVTAQLVEQALQLLMRQNYHRFLIAFTQAVQRFFQLVWILLYKAVCHLTDTLIETVSGIERTLGAFAKVFGKRRG
ncbi:hypothetical protein D3C80_1669470 [compost metagenome]